MLVAVDIAEMDLDPGQAILDVLESRVQLGLDHRHEGVVGVDVAVGVDLDLHLTGPCIDSRGDRSRG